MRSDVASPLRPWRVFSRRLYVALAIALLLLMGGSKIFLAGAPQAIGYIMFYSKEGVIESLGAMFCFMALAFFVAGIILPRSIVDISFPPASRVWLLILALLSLGMAGEELGWGTRWVKWVSPAGAAIQEFEFGELLKPKGSQTNVLAVYWTLGTFIWAAVLPWLIRRSRNANRLAHRFGLPFPSPCLSLMWLAVSFAALVGIANPGALRLGPLEVEPAFESSFELLFLAWAAEEYYRVRASAQRQGSFGLLAVLGVILIASIASVAYDIRVRTWPATRSQQLYSSALLKADSDDEGERREAKRLLEESIAAFPGNDAAFHAMGIMLIKEGENAEAVRYLYEAVQLIPDSGLYHHTLGKAYLNMRDPKTLGSALRELEEAIRLLPADDPARTDAILEREYIFGLKRVAEQVGSNPQFKKKMEEIRRESRVEEGVNARSDGQPSP